MTELPQHWVVFEPDDYERGWMDADIAITQQLPGCDLSQGDSEWDAGWNARVLCERGRMPTAVEDDIP